MTFIGLLLDGIGAFLLIIPDLPNGRVRQFFYENLTKVKYIRNSQEKLADGRNIHYDQAPDELEVTFPAVCREFGFDNSKEPNAIKRTHKGIRVDYQDNSKSDRINIENIEWLLRNMTNRLIERYFAKWGAILLMSGFVLQGIDAILSLFN